MSVYCLTSIDANSVDPDQTTHTGREEQSGLDLHCLIKRLQNVSVDIKNIRLFVICALRVNRSEIS